MMAGTIWSASRPVTWSKTATASSSIVAKLS
jgi:hypothetical protein